MSDLIWSRKLPELLSYRETYIQKQRSIEIQKYRSTEIEENGPVRMFDGRSDLLNCQNCWATEAKKRRSTEIQKHRNRGEWASQDAWWRIWSRTASAAVSPPSFKTALCKGCLGENGRSHQDCDYNVIMIKSKHIKGSFEGMCSMSVCNTF